MPDEDDRGVLPDHGGGSTVALDLDERAAVRAYLQRSEVRLSTMHRVATALLSGAGLMVLLPAVVHDSVVSVVRSLLSGPIDGVHLVLLAAIGASLAVPLTALWLVLRDLTQFYFHANHIGHDAGEAFVPRFTLTALRLPRGELGPTAAIALEHERRGAAAIGLLVPANDAARRRIDQRVAAYGGLGIGTASDDEGRAAALFVLAGSRARPLLDEVAKVEHGMARHVLRTQTIVLRYVKALLALLTTALAAFASAAVVDAKPTLTTGDEAWLAGILLVWAPTVIVAVTTPVRWLQRLLRNEGATTTAVGQDREMTSVEDATVRLAIGSFLAAAGAIGTCLSRADLTTPGRVTAAGLLVGSTVTLVAVLWRWSDGHPLARLLRRG